MSIYRALPLVVFLLACVSHGSSPDPDPCGELGCASFPGTVTLTVRDAVTGLPIDKPLTFTAPQFSGNAPFTCSDLTAVTCPSWQLSFEGSFDIAVAAPGYQPGTVHVLIEGPAGCCGKGPDTMAELSLTPS
jgi:hypothetical protein